MTQAPPVPAVLTDLQRQHAESVQEMRAVSEAVRDLLAHLQPSLSGQAVTFNNKPFPLKFKGRRHAYVWLPAQSVLTLEYPGMQGASLTFSSGWNDFDYPEGTQISAAAAVTGYLRLTNEMMVAPQPSDAGAGVQGWIAAAGTGTASQDDALTFAGQVRKVVLYNASANPVPFEFDQVSAADSIPIPPGSIWVMDDVLCSAVHVFPSALLPINTTGGLYVKGWQ